MSSSRCIFFVRMKYVRIAPTTQTAIEISNTPMNFGVASSVAGTGAIVVGTAVGTAVITGVGTAVTIGAGVTTGAVTIGAGVTIGAVTIGVAIMVVGAVVGVNFEVADIIISTSLVAPLLNFIVFPVDFASPT